MGRHADGDLWLGWRHHQGGRGAGAVRASRCGGEERANYERFEQCGREARGECK